MEVGVGVGERVKGEVGLEDGEGEGERERSRERQKIESGRENREDK